MGLTASRVSLNHRHECICEKMTVSVAGGAEQHTWAGMSQDAGCHPPEAGKPGH